MNNEQCDDSNFQKEGDYIMNKMPKYKYNIKIIHDYRHKKEKSKEPDKIVSSERFSILNEPKNTLKKITLQKNYKNHNNEDFNQLHKSNSPRMGTIRFYPQELCFQDDNIVNTSYKKLYKNKGIYYQNYDNYRTNNNEIYNDYRNDEYYDNIDFHYDNNNYNNMDYYYENEIVHQNYNNDNFRNNNYHNYYNKNLDYNNSYENENDSYIIDIFPKRPCICQREIGKIINDYYFSDNRIYKNNIISCNRKCRCGLNICDRNNMTVINDNINRKNNIYNYYNYCSPPRSMRNNYPKTIDKTMKKLQYPKYQNKHSNYIVRSPNYKTPYYYFVKGNKLNDKQNNKLYNINNDTNMDNNNYNNNSYIDISNKSKLKKEILTKKIKISSKNDKTPKKEIRNNSFISIDNIRDKNLMVKNSPYVKRKKIDKINYNNISKYESKDLNLCNNLNSTYISIRKRSNNIMISKSSEKKEKIKVFPLGKKIYPLIVKKSVEKPKKEKIINKDGTTTNVIKQTSVITSIESKPIQAKKYNLKNQTYVKENITKIYTTLTKDDIDVNANSNHINKSNNIGIVKDKENLKDANEDNLNKSNYNKNKINDKNKNIDMNYKDIKDDYNEIDNDFLMITKNINNFNNNSPFSNTSLNSNTYEQSDFNNSSKINKHINYIKYLYNRCNNSNSIDGNKEESLSSYFLKFNDEEKKEILNAFKDGKVEDKKIYNKLMKILKESIISEVKNNFGDDAMIKNNN